MTTSLDLSWQPVTLPIHSDYLTKGAVLALATVGCHSRFSIKEVRSRASDGSPSVIYRVHDADKVTDAELAEGKLSPAVFWAATPDEALDYVALHDACPWQDADEVRTSDDD
jgi:hypothetical protein